MSEVRAVFVDLDDTFLAPDKSIPAPNLRLMDELAARGIELVPCTGRHVGGVPQTMLEHPCVRHVVASNGGIVHDLGSSRDMRVVAIPTADIMALYERIGGWPILFDAFADGKAYTEQARFGLFDEIDVAPGLRAYLKAGRTPVETTIPQLLPSIGPVTKLSIFFVDEEAARACREGISALPDLYYVQTSAANYETMNRHATKGDALKWLCGAMGWDVSQTVAFGDNNNDVTMIEAAGDGVVMENGEPQVKALANHIAPPAAEGGVARYLQHLLA
ncbi:MAG: HAD hydrolase family protein [Atopobiaceae bacterium]|nr:HAD hydrolase family protein [Atopobiaceae bacterium]